MNPSSGKTPATTISFTIYGQRFQLLAAPEEHERIRRVAEAVDAQIQGQRERAASELRAILMAAYEIGYELDELESQTHGFAETRHQLAQAEETLQKVSETTDRLIERIDREIVESAPPALAAETALEPERPGPGAESAPAQTEESEPVADAEESPGAVSAEEVESASIEEEADVPCCGETEVAGAVPAFEIPEDETLPDRPFDSVSLPEENDAPEIESDQPETPESVAPDAIESGVSEWPLPESEAQERMPSEETPDREVSPPPAEEAVVGPENAGLFVLDATPPEVESPLPTVEEIASEDLSADDAASVAPACEAEIRLEQESGGATEAPSPAEIQPFARPSVQDLWGGVRSAEPVSPPPEPESPLGAPEMFSAPEDDLIEMEMRLPDVEMDLADVEFGIQVDEPFEMDSAPESEDREGAPLFGFPSASGSLPRVEAGWPDVESFSLDESAPAPPTMEPFVSPASVAPEPSPSPETRPAGFLRPSPSPIEPPSSQIRPSPLRKAQDSRATEPPSRLFELPGQSRYPQPPLAPAQDTRVRPSSRPEFKTIGAKPWMGASPSDPAKPFETRNFLFGNPDKKMPTKPPIFHDTVEKKPRSNDNVQPSLFPYLDERLKKPDPKTNK